jgi:regulator of nonsense transcripts 2
MQEQDKRNHEAYIRSGEIFEDRQQAYEKMTRSYEKLLASCQSYAIISLDLIFSENLISLSELLNLPLPTLPAAVQKSESIFLSTSSDMNGVSDDIITPGGKWEDEEERRFYEEIQDLRDFVPSSVLGVDSSEADEVEKNKENDRIRAEKAKDDVKKLEEELEKLSRENEEEQPSNEGLDEE